MTLCRSALTPLGNYFHLSICWPPGCCQKNGMTERVPKKRFKTGKSSMAEQQQSYPPLRDPDNVAEILCDGPFNLSTMGDLVTLTFTQVRPKADELFAGASAARECIVRARIVCPSSTTLALRA